MRNGFVFYRYKREDRRLLAEYLNTFTRAAFGFQWGTFFIGVMLSQPKPPHIVSINFEDETP